MKRPTKDQAEFGAIIAVLVSFLAYHITARGWVHTIALVVGLVIMISLFNLVLWLARKAGR